MAATESCSPNVGQKTNQHPFFAIAKRADTEPTQMELYQINATVRNETSVLALPAPLTALAKPTVAAALRWLLKTPNQPVPHQNSGFASALVVDQFDNPVSNSEMTFTGQAGTNACLGDGALGFYRTNECQTQIGTERYNCAAAVKTAKTSRFGSAFLQVVPGLVFNQKQRYKARLVGTNLIPTYPNARLVRMDARFAARVRQLLTRWPLLQDAAISPQAMLLAWLQHCLFCAILCRISARQT
jgi:hypothetical protein